MNNRDYKICAPGEYYHIYNRGNGKQNIFQNTEDYKFFIKRLNFNLYPPEEDGETIRIQKLPPDSFSLLCYCLMPNHFHLLIKQNGNVSTSKLINKLCTSYSKFFNKKYDRVGHLFQGCFKQINVTDNEYLKWLSCYIHQNPKTAGLTKKLEDYRWSSYNQHITGEGDIVCEPAIITDQFKNINEYKKFIDDSLGVLMKKKEFDHILLDA